MSRRSPGGQRERRNSRSWSGEEWEEFGGEREEKEKEVVCMMRKGGEGGEERCGGLGIYDSC